MTLEMGAFAASILAQDQDLLAATPSLPLLDQGTNKPHQFCLQNQRFPGLWK